MAYNKLTDSGLSGYLGALAWLRFAGLPEGSMAGGTCGRACAQKMVVPARAQESSIES